MSKARAVQLYTKYCKASGGISTIKSFTQDGRHCRPMVQKLHSVCDGHLFSSVVTGRASGKADTPHIATRSGLFDVAERGHIDSSTHADSLENHVDDLHKAADNAVLANNMDQKVLT